MRSFLEKIYLANDRLYFPTVDLTKNVCELVDVSGTLAATYDYAPFGEVSSAGTVANPLQWSSEIYDSELALVYYNYRHYSPYDGRFLSRDPIAEQGGRNLYAFVKNNGITIVDFRGHIMEGIGNAFTCSAGFIWNGISCVAEGVGGGFSCAAGYVWDGLSCVGSAIAVGTERIVDGVVQVWDETVWLVRKTIDVVLGSCGSGTIQLLVVPNRPLFLATVTGCCEAHDECYSTLCASKKACDDALGACVREKISANLGIADLGGLPSGIIGEGYRFAVHHWGNGAFEEAQRKACADAQKK